MELSYRLLITNLRKSIHSPANEQALLRRKDKEPRQGITTREAAKVLALALQMPLEDIIGDLK